MSPAPDVMSQAEEMLAKEAAPTDVKQAPGRPMTLLAELADQDVRWRRLLRDPDNLFTGAEAISEEYAQYLLDMVSVMEENGCTFKQAVLIASSEHDLGSSASELGVVKYLKMRKAGYCLSDALISNLKCSSLGSGRATSCAWRRKEAKKALSSGALAVEIAESTLAKGLDCTEYELTVVEQSLSEAHYRCYHLDRAIEILEANSKACGECEAIMAEYAELSAEAVKVMPNIEKHAKQLCELKARMWSFEYLGVLVHSFFSSFGLRRMRCCSLESQRVCAPRAQMMLNLRRSQEMRVEILAVSSLASRSELDSVEDSIGCAGDVDASGISVVSSQDGGEGTQRNIYVEVQLSGCRRTAPLDSKSAFAHRHMLFAYDGEPTLHVQVFERSGLRIQSMISGDVLIGEAVLLLDPPAQDGAPRMVDLAILNRGKQTGLVMLRYQLVTY